MRLLLDIGPLHHSPTFRRIWFGQALSQIGGGIAAFALALQAYRTTGSSAVVGLLTATAGLPLVVFSVVGGVVADRLDRRRLARLTALARVVISAALATQALLGSTRVWPLFVLEALAGSVNALQSPVRSAILNGLLDPDQRVAGATLNGTTFHLGNTAGPALGGLITATVGLGWCYPLDTLTFLAALYGVLRLPPLPRPTRTVSGHWQDLREGLRFFTRDRVLLATLLADLDATVLGMPFALFPAVVAERFHGSPTVLGWLTAAPTLGGLIASILSGPASRAHRPGRAQLTAVALWGLGLTVFGFSHRLTISVASLVFAGAVDNIGVVQRAGIIRTRTPDQLMGRVSSVEIAVGAGAPGLGNLEAGLLATATTTTISAVSGGLGATVGAGLLALAFPALRRYRAAPTGREAGHRVRPAEEALPE